ncbi:cytochrome-c oxidase [Erythrobacter sp. 3-20A1M]|uniref:cytochrome o ubiquinol oxidase subunit IV n=1 Tax=Erythrobacter sp. 3-20A1M TaxID=2653850 RepID=UPI001BFC2E6E|nr:cytochrome C oxidase subunit IV family protein [Erythrobacter sp. 3-20A1M]QWC56723.1 cytochrome-c oxidase [Erythrobacter sp. 3-20A1M]
MSERDDERRELRDSWLALAGAVVLTAASFALVVLLNLPRGWTLGGLALLALAQIAWHFRYFLHIDLDRSHRHDLQLILFTSLIIVMMVGGTLWILFDLHARMM